MTAGAHKPRVSNVTVWLFLTDDDGSDQSSGHETPASSSSRQDLDADEGKKKKKTKGKKKEKKSKGKKKAEDSGDELEKKPKKKGFGILRLEVLFLIFHIKNVLIKNAALAVKTGEISDPFLL